MKNSELINFGSRILRNGNISSHLLDSELILSFILKKSREKLLVSEEKTINKKNFLYFNRLIKRRLKNEPIAYIFHRKEFWKKKFIVNKHTLIPRPETELLVETVVKDFKKKNPLILDVGTGTGCILISILEELKRARGIGIDISKRAISVAKLNIQSTSLKKRIKFLKKSISEKFTQKFDLIVSNPPYIQKAHIKNLSKDIRNYEPRVALDGGNDGLDVIKKVIYKATNILKFKGTLALEIGYGQYKKVSYILKKNSFREKTLIRDYRNNVRCMLYTFEN